MTGSSASSACAAVTFDAERHRYEIDGRPVPGITSVLRAGGLLAGMREDRAAMEFGRAIHFATELDDLGYPGEATKDAEIVPYVEAWRKAKLELELEILEIEALKGDATYRYATQIDRIVRWKEQVAVVNIKTGGVYPHYAIQLAGEAMLLHPYDPLRPRLGIHLDERGGYKLCQYTDTLHDYDAFRACLVLFWHKEVLCPTL